MVAREIVGFAAVSEIDVRASAGHGAVHEGLEESKQTWLFPDPVIRHEFRARPQDLHIVTIDGDSMEPLLSSGDRILVDSSQRVPVPPGIFVIWDGMGLVSKRIEHIPNSEPTKIERLWGRSPDYSLMPALIRAPSRVGAMSTRSACYGDDCLINRRSKGMRTLKTWAAAAAMVALSGAAYATPVFQGRMADGTASATCTVSGATKCAMFYNTTLDLTILNDWNIGRGFWSGSVPPAAGSAQALAEAAGAAQTDFTGWFLPTGDRGSVAGALNQYLSIWNDVGNSLAGLQAQFDGVQSNDYWSGTEYSGTEYAQNSGRAWFFGASDGLQSTFHTHFVRSAVAVRPGDVTAPVPEPQTLALALLALGATAVARRRRSR